jgi:hypothetical protein
MPRTNMSLLKRLIVLDVFLSSPLFAEDINPFEVMQAQQLCESFNNARNVCATAGDFRNCMQIKFDSRVNLTMNEIQKVEKSCTDLNTLIYGSAINSFTQAFKAAVNRKDEPKSDSSNSSQTNLATNEQHQQVIVEKKVSLDNGKLYSLEEQTVGTLQCSSTKIQFARGMRWTPVDFSPVLSFDDNNITLDPGCYSEMSCVEYKGVESLLLVVTACGGNAVGDEYHVFNLKNQNEKVLEAVWQNIKRILQGLILSLRFGSYFLQ